MKDFNDYILIKKPYDIKFIVGNNAKPITVLNNTIEYALRRAYNTARVCGDVQIYLRPAGVEQLLYIKSFSISRDGDLYDYMQNISIQYIKQNGQYGSKRWDGFICQKKK